MRSSQSAGVAPVSRRARRYGQEPVYKHEVHISLIVKFVCSQYLRTCLSTNAQPMSIVHGCTDVSKLQRLLGMAARIYRLSCAPCPRHLLLCQKKLVVVWPLVTDLLCRQRPLLHLFGYRIPVQKGAQLCHDSRLKLGETRSSSRHWKAYLALRKASNRAIIRLTESLCRNAYI